MFRCGNLDTPFIWTHSSLKVGKKSDTVNVEWVFPNISIYVQTNPQDGATGVGHSQSEGLIRTFSVEDAGVNIKMTQAQLITHLNNEFANLAFDSLQICTMSRFTCFATGQHYSQYIECGTLEFTYVCGVS